MMEADKLIYLDNAATTVVNNEVLEAYNKAKRLYFANPSSIHIPGQEANRMLEKAREQILNILKCSDHELIFTSGATEANNLAIKGYAFKRMNRGKHIIVSNIEHPSVLEVAKQLEENFGFEVTYLPVNSQGIVEVETLKRAIKNDTILVSIMAVNNEIGTINHIHDIAVFLKNYPLIAFHVDATQAMGKIDLPYNEIDMISFSGHKIHGLKGSGALIAKQTLSFEPVISGGGQEEAMRSGTVSVALACSLAKAIKNSFPIKNMQEKHDFLVEKLEKIQGISMNSNKNCSPFIVNFSLTEKKASVVVEALSNKGIYVSSVSACHSKREASSYVVAALGKDEKLAHNTMRVSMSNETTIEELEIFVKELKNILETIK